jgi:hypothetical protein
MTAFGEVPTAFYRERFGECAGRGAGAVKKNRNSVSRPKIIGDAREVQDIFTAVQAGYQLAAKY